MVHYLCLKTDDQKLKIDGSWPNEFITEHGDDFDCEIEVYFIADETMDSIDDGEISYCKNIIDIIQIEDICIYVNGDEIKGLTRDWMRKQVRDQIEQDPDILIQIAHNEINPGYHYLN